MNIESIAEALLDANNRTSVDPKNRYVYVLFAAGAPVYVGYTKALESRLVAHIDSDKVFDSYSFLTFLDQETAINVERELIRTLKPAYNKAVAQIPYVFKAEVENARLERKQRNAGFRAVMKAEREQRDSERTAEMAREYAEHCARTIAAQGEWR